MTDIRPTLKHLFEKGYQPMYNGRPSCPFCFNFIDEEQGHTSDCSLRAYLRAEVTEDRFTDTLAAVIASPPGHPDDPLRHDFVTTCTKCGEPATLVISLITPDEQVRTERRE